MFHSSDGHLKEQITLTIYPIKIIINQIGTLECRCVVGYFLALFLLIFLIVLQLFTQAASILSNLLDYGTDLKLPTNAIHQLACFDTA